MLLLSVCRFKKQLLITIFFFPWTISNFISTEKSFSPVMSKCGIQPDNITINFSYKIFSVFFIMCPSWDSALIRSIRLEKLSMSSNPDRIIAANYLIRPCWQVLICCLKEVKFLSTMPSVRGCPRLLQLQSLETLSEYPAYICSQVDYLRTRGLCFCPVWIR